MPLPSFLQRFRRSGPDHAAPELSATPAMDVEAARTRARRQLIGMLVLVVAGVLGFPWLFDTQPGPLSQDVQVVQAGSDGLVDASGAGRAPIAGRVGVAAIEAPATAPEKAASPPDIMETDEPAAVSPKPEAQAVAKPMPKAPVSAVAHVAEASPKVADKVTDKVTDKVAADKKAAEKKAADKAAADKKAAEKLAADKAAADKKLAEARKADAKRAEAAKSVGTKEPVKDAAKDSSKEPVRYVVQFGAFADNAAAQAARAKVEKLGIKTYAQTIDTPAGKRTRVRVGPYATKAEADKANAAIQKAGMSGSVLTL